MNARSRKIIDRFDGRILGAGSSSGVRVVVGDWAHSPLGAFADVMVATSTGARVLIAPNNDVAQYVSSTYQFDQVIITPVELHDWELTAGPLQVHFEIGGRTPTGRLLRAIPSAIARTRPIAVLADPIARRVHPGVRTVGSAGGGRREYYSALDQYAVTGLSGTYEGADLGKLRDVTPDPRFGFSSTPRTPSLTRIVTTVVRPA